MLRYHREIFPIFSKKILSQKVVLFVGNELKWAMMKYFEAVLRPKKWGRESKNNDFGQKR